MLTTTKTAVLNTRRADPEWQLASSRNKGLLVEFCQGVGKDTGRGTVPGSPVVRTSRMHDCCSSQQG